MDVFIDFNARGALEDRQLQDSWKAAQNEYNRYHSLKRAGDDWVRLLTPKEIDEVKRVMGLSVEDDIGSAIDEPASIMQWEIVTPKKDETSNGDDTNGEMDDTLQSTLLDGVAGPESAIAATGEEQGPQPPQDILESIQDEAMRNLALSWYYAGYYTGYFEGQRSAGKRTNGA